MSKRWLITGGCSQGGLGYAIARAALDAGNQVAVTARNLEKVSKLVQDYGDRAYPVILDLNDKESIENAVNQIMEHFGGIDVLINNARYCYRSSVEESNEEDVMEMVQTNFFGLIDLTKRVLPFMREKHEGTIVNISSIAAISASPASAFYASSKSALELMSDGLRKEVSPLGIRVIVVESGAFRTNFFSRSLKGTKMKIADYKDTAWKRYPENAVDLKISQAIQISRQTYS